VAEGGSQGTLVSGVAQRYATALFELAEEAGAIDTGAAALDNFNGLLSASGDRDRLIQSAARTAAAEVTVAEEPTAKRVDEIRAALKGVAGKDVDVSIKIDPALIGGLIVKMGSRMVDASLKTKLNSIRLAMKEVG